MNLKGLPRRRGATGNENLELGNLWALRILDRAADKRHLAHRLSLVMDEASLLLGLGERKRPASARELGALIKARLRAAEAKTPAMPDSLASNLALIGEFLELTSLEREILAFRVLAKASGALSRVLSDCLGSLSDGRLADVIGAALDQRPGEALAALAPRGALCGSDLMRLDPHYVAFFEKLRVVPGLPNAMLRPNPDIFALVSFAVERAPAPGLTLADFPHLELQVALLRNYLSAGVAAGLRGMNVLIHGAPGTGKTELVRALVADLGWTLYEVAAEAGEGGEDPRAARFQAYAFLQRLLGRSRSVALIFDEVEDAFPAAGPGLNLQGSGTSRSKAWVNRVLEEGRLPAFWVCNRIGQIDPAFLRRFDLIVEIRTPPRAVRRRILEGALAGLPAAEGWMERFAQCEALTPALAVRAARVVRAAHAAVPEDAARQFESVVAGHLRAAGLETQLPAKSGAPDHYGLDTVNTTEPLEPLADGLARTGAGRLLLYGPPGTGKTAFARHLARRIGQPLIERRASDLLSPWLGETEQELRRMFEQARSDGAVLLLDEADGLLRDRQQAVRSWEVTQVNELLTGMEAFDGVFLCATNHRETLDPASLRRFHFKIRFGYLTPPQRWTLLQRVFPVAHEAASEEERAVVERALGNLNNLTPGDFAVVASQAAFRSTMPALREIVEALRRECELKSDAPRRGIGFC